MASFDYRCPTCKTVYDVKAPTGSTITHICPVCVVQTVRYFGMTRPVDVNVGLQDHHDSIERYRFQNLSHD